MTSSGDLVTSKKEFCPSNKELHSNRILFFNLSWKHNLLFVYKSFWFDLKLKYTSFIHYLVHTFRIILILMYLNCRMKQYYNILSLISNIIIYTVKNNFLIEIYININKTNYFSGYKIFFFTLYLMIFT